MTTVDQGKTVTQTIIKSEEAQATVPAVTVTKSEKGEAVTSVSVKTITQQETTVVTPTGPSAKPYTTTKTEIQVSYKGTAVPSNVPAIPDEPALPSGGGSGTTFSTGWTSSTAVTNTFISKATSVASPLPPSSSSAIDAGETTVSPTPTEVCSDENWDESCEDFDAPTASASASASAGLEGEDGDSYDSAASGSYQASSLVAFSFSLLAVLGGAGAIAF